MSLKPRATEAELHRASESLSAGKSGLDGVSPHPGSRKRLARWISLGVAVACSTCALAQVEDFDSGSDAAWIRVNPLAILGVTPAHTFGPDGFGGWAYRMQGFAPPIVELGPARVLTHLPGTYTHLYLAVDIVGWDNSLDQGFGVLLRGETIGLGQTTGYVVNYDPQQFFGDRGQLQLNMIRGEQPVSRLGSANVTLDPRRRYRLAVSAVAGDFVVSVYDSLDLTEPLATFKTSDPVYSSGVVGLFNSYLGRSINDPALGRSDSTFDNFVAAVNPPATPAFPATPQSVPHTPQVVNRLPASRANFHPATNGLRFNVTTLTTNRVTADAVRLWLNREEVTSQLRFEGSNDLLLVSFEGLANQRVYDARIVVRDLAGRASTNEWYFDTLTEDYLESGAVKIIEAEDYNYDGGKFQDDPAPSGLASGGAVIDGGGRGYFGRTGIPGVDFLDRSLAATGGVVAEYRAGDPVGTQAGSLEIYSSGQTEPAGNDTRRRKSARLDLPEYEVVRTEGGEWLNYTRTFAAGEYAVHLRVAARAAQAVHLDRVTSDPTQPNPSSSPLGTFAVPNLGLLTHYRYVPLTGALGSPVTIRLSGLETLRLTLGGPPQDTTQNTMALNYLLFIPVDPVPTEWQVESAAVLAGPYLPDPTALIDAQNRSFDIPIKGQAGFFRLRGTGPAPRIINVRRIGEIFRARFEPAN